jgi:hypothetical protein
MFPRQITFELKSEQFVTEWRSAKNLDEQPHENHPLDYDNLSMTPPDGKVLSFGHMRFGGM